MATSAAALGSWAEGNLTVADKFGVHVDLKNPLGSRIRAHPNVSTADSHTAGVPGLSSHRLQQLSLPIDEPSFFRQGFRLGQLIGNGRWAGELLLANPQALGCHCD